MVAETFQSGLGIADYGECVLTGQVFENPEVWRKLSFKHNRVVRSWVGKGLFTCDDDEPEWGVAHRILIGAFSNQGMK